MMKADYLHYPYASRRMAVFAKKGMVATSQPLAAQAGLDMLKRGGNAIDAAIATAAALTVLEPTSNGIGGDAFALVWVKDRLHGLNASGPAPAAVSVEGLERVGVKEMPRFGWTPVTVPGVPSAWGALSKRFGKLPLTQVLQPAITYAEEGYPISPILGKYWQRAFELYRQQGAGGEYQGWFHTFAPHGRAPHIGEMWASPDHAATLKEIAESEGEAFYKGDLADRIDRFSQSTGGYIRKADLEGYAPEWVTPVHVNYRGYDVWELPPNGQGIIGLMALNILKGFEFAVRDTVDTYHKQIEAMKLAFVDGMKFITDARHMPVTVDDLLSDGYADERRKLIGQQALPPQPGNPRQGGTVYLATADDEGNMVSYIQSNYMGFGSGIVVPGTGIALQNRGHTFSLNKEDANVLQPGKRTFHTIIPGFLTKNGAAIGPFGVMGGYMQPQGHVQVIMNTVDFGMNPQAALDAPRWQWMEGKTVEVEHQVPEHIVNALARRGHQIRIAVDAGGFGRGQIIWRDEHGVCVGGTEPRTDGGIAAW